MWLIIIEVILISLLMASLYRIVRRYRSLSKEDYPEAIERLAAALSVVFGNGKLLSIIMTEIKMLYYAFFAKRFAFKYSEKQFSYVKATSFHIVAIPLLIIVVIESGVLHLLIHQFLIVKFNYLWLKVIPWVIHLFNAYVFVFYMAQIRAIKLLPHTVDGDSMTIHYGILGRINIPYSEIVKIEKPNTNTLDLKEDKQTFYAKNKVDTPQLLITLNNKIPVQLLYGRTKLVNKVLCIVDDDQRLRTLLNQQITSLE